MNLDDIKKETQEILDIGVNDTVKKLFARHSDDDDRKSLALIRSVVGKFNLFCRFFESKTFEHPEGDPIKDGVDSGRLVRVRPCSEEYKGKTFIGVYIGDAALSSSVTMKESSIVCKWTHYNPAILVPEINKVIYGCGSWWSFISDEESKKITDEDINNTWYVKLAKALVKGKP